MYKILTFLFAIHLFACASPKDGFITGTVTEIQPGKDGYTAKINTENNQAFFVTISHANLKDPAQYRSSKIGDTLKVKGEEWKLENEKHITVRELKPAGN